MLLATDWPGFAKGLWPDAVPGALPISGVFELEPLLPTSLAAALDLTPAEAHALSPRWLPPPSQGALHAVGINTEEGNSLLELLCLTG